MKFYKFISIFFILFVFFMSNSLIELNSISKDNTPPTIKIITPNKSQDYIISRPTIKVNFSDKNGINLSSVKLYVNNKDVTNKAKIKKDTIQYTPDKKFKRGTQIVKIYVSDNAQNKSTLEWYFTVGTPIYKDFKGNFVDIENTDKSCNKLYKEPNFYKDIDCFIVSSLSSTSQNILDEFKNNMKKYAQNQCISFNAAKIALNLSNDVVTIYNAKENFKNASKLDTENLYKNLFYKNDLICSFNPNSNNINTFNYMKYSYYGDAIFSLLDITNKSLDSEYPFYLKIYNQALDNGWHISPFSTKFTTKILSTDLNIDSLLNGLKNRRTYVTNNKNLNLEFTINNSHMGSIIKNPSKLIFNISAVDSTYENNLKNIYVISNNNKIIKNINCNSYLAKSEFTLKEFEQYSYYYLIILQDNNKISVSAPIWIESK